MLDNTTNQPCNFRTKNWAEINDGASETYNSNSQMKFINTMLKSNLCDYGNAYKLVKGAMSVIGAKVNDAARGADTNDKQAVY